VNLKEIFRLLKQIIGYGGQVNYAPERAGDVKHSVADLSQIEEQLGYHPLVDIELGLRRTVEWYRSSVKS